MTEMVKMVEELVVDWDLVLAEDAATQDHSLRLMEQTKHFQAGLIDCLIHLDPTEVEEEMYHLEGEERMPLELCCLFNFSVLL